MDVASFFDGLITDDVVAIQAVVKDYTFSLRSPLPDLEELFFRVIKPHRNTLEYLGVFCAKLELAYSRALAREPTAASRLPASILSDLAAAFAPYIIRPNVWGAAQDVQTKRRAKFLQHRFVLLFWFFFKRKHNLVTRAERADLNRGSQEVRKESCTRAQGAEHVNGGLCVLTCPWRDRLWYGLSDVAVQVLQELLRAHLPRSTLQLVQSSLRRMSSRA